MSTVHYQLPWCICAISGCKIRSDSKRKDYVHFELLYLYPDTDNQIFYLLFSYSELILFAVVTPLSPFWWALRKQGNETWFLYDLRVFV